MRQETRQRKQAITGLRAMAGEGRMLGTLVRIIGVASGSLRGTLNAASAEGAAPAAQDSDDDQSHRKHVLAGPAQ